jgi:tetratricopeptide (TPR) repeat protein
MWHLILPPLIIISGIGILLWFFSRKMDDSSFLSRVKSAKGEVSAVSRSRSLSRKAFFLKLLETFASKFKTNSLRIHNFFQYSLERLREKRRVLDAMRREVKESDPVQAKEEVLPENERRWFGLRRKKAEPEHELVETKDNPIISDEPIAKEVVSVPEKVVEPSIPRGEESRFSSFGIFRRNRRSMDDEVENVAQATEEELPPEPALREVARPDKPRQRVVEEKDPREEVLIGRIADNPRDAVSYEELGDLYLAAKNMQDAKACYRQVLKLHPTNRAVKLKIRKVERFFEKSVS